MRQKALLTNGTDTENNFVLKDSSNTCTSLKIGNCPLKRGQRITYTSRFRITSPFNGDSVSNFKLTLANEHARVITCLEVPFRIQNSSNERILEDDDDWLKTAEKYLIDF